MTTDYLQTTRKAGLAADSRYSEAELIETNDGIKEAWNAIMAIKAKIFEAKRDALEKVNEEFGEELAEAEADYAMLLSLTR